MASLSEMIQYAQAQQRPDPLAGIASHFIAGADSGYDAGHAEALKKAAMNAENPVINTPQGPQRLAVYSKLLDIQKSLLEKKNEELLYNVFKEQTGVQDTADRTTSLSTIATNALNANGAPAGAPTVASKVAEVAANPSTAGTVRKPTKTTIEMVGGKPTMKIEYGNAEKTTAAQLNAIRSYVDNPKDPQTSVALSAQFPDGMPDWATKFMASHADLKQKAQAVADQKNQVEQDKLEHQYEQLLSKGISARSGGLGVQDAKINQAIHVRQALEANRDPATGELHVNQLTSPEVALGLSNLVSGSNNTNVEEFRAMTPQALSADIKKKVGYIFGKPVDVLPSAWVDQLQHLVDRQGVTSDFLKENYTKGLRGLKPTRLDPERAKALESAQLGSKYSEVFGMTPEQTASFMPKKGSATAESRTGSGDQVPTISSDADFKALPSGTVFKDPSGQTHRKK